MSFEMSQDQNGIYWACLRDEAGQLECATLKATRFEVDQWLVEQGIKSLLFADGLQLSIN